MLERLLQEVYILRTYLRPPDCTSHELIRNVADLVDVVQNIGSRPEEAPGDCNLENGETG